MSARRGQMISNWSDEIHFRTSPKSSAEIQQLVPESNQWMAGVITGAVLLIICLIVIAVVNTHIF